MPHDLGIPGPQFSQRQVGVPFVNPRRDERHRRLGSAGLDGIEPVIELALLVAVPRVPGQHKEGTGGQEELVGGVVDLLPAKVPGVELHGDACFGRMCQFQRFDPDAVRGG